MKAEGIRNISVIGAGFIGPGIAQIFASRGYPVRLVDIKDELLPKALENIRFNLSLMAAKGLLPESEIDIILGKVKTTTDMGEATLDVQLVIEAVTENLELKQKVFRDLDQLCPPNTILATNTSVISITEIAAKAHRQERIIGTHFWNPPYLIPLVEVIKGKMTSDKVFETTYQFLKSVGKHPVKVMKDVPGFIGNRMQHALWREAISIVENGIADPASVDDVIKKGFGIRLPVIGPLENADMVGLDLTLAIHNYILKYIDSSPKPSSLLREKVAREELGFKTGQGFQTWSTEQIKSSRDKLLEYLIDWNKREQGKNKN
jgi:3-hydroxybutyryl-CoA dehydrogenase